MTIHWPFLLVLPLSSALKRYVLRSRKNSSASTTALFPIWQNWADLLRAGVGTFLLMQHSLEFDPETAGAANKALMIEAGVLVSAVLCQSISFAEQLKFIAPIFYLSGVTVALAGYQVGGFAVFVGWLFALGGKKPGYQLPMMAIGLGSAAYTLGMLDLNVILSGGLIIIPMFLGFMSKQSLSYMARRPVWIEDSVGPKVSSTSAPSPSK
jgi:hypothetical protein